ncbi:hypothetical protein BN80_187 [Yersinia phage phiR1-RT]|uniref:Uncharacterized protein n=1 Tax=Yersinia phage phiR1-RT TaxID=1206558 RepID=I7LEN6_BPPR1|nr:hypothetical protein BN80_187 [Yersinia phage phiR1-RT]CCI88757.1 hypothetical protein BN80_187 [Yersinia phage phiR1-RT]
MTLGCTIVSDKPSVSYGEQFTLTATPSGVPSGAQTNYIWKKGGVDIAGGNSKDCRIGW